jgi:hypothetical protein
MGGKVLAPAASKASKENDSVPPSDCVPPLEALASTNTVTPPSKLFRLMSGATPFAPGPDSRRKVLNGTNGPGAKVTEPPNRVGEEARPPPVARTSNLAFFFSTLSVISKTALKLKLWATRPIVTVRFPAFTSLTANRSSMAELGDGGGTGGRGTNVTFLAMKTTRRFFLNCASVVAFFSFSCCVPSPNDLEFLVLRRRGSDRFRPPRRQRHNRGMDRRGPS